MKHDRLYHVALTILFLLFIGLPGACMFFTEEESISQSEKRALAEFPKVCRSISSILAFPQKFEAYMEDHFGFRHIMVRVHNLTLCKVFHVPPTSAVMLGRKDWYFYNGDAAVYDYLGKFRYNKTQLEQVKNVLEDRKYWLSSMGAHYLFLPVPNKESIYEEYLPHRLREHRGVDKYDQIIGYLSQEGSFQDFIDIKKIMLAHKEEGQLYLRTDSHWNNDGAYLVYLEIIGRLRKWFPDLIPLARQSPKHWIENFSGDLCTMMNLEGLITEVAPDIDVEQSCEPRQVKTMHYLTKIPEYRDIAENKIPVETGCDTQKYKAIFIHDSFGKFMMPFLAQNFQTVIFDHYLSFEQAKTMIERERPDIVLDLRVGRNLEKAVIPDPALEQMVLRDEFGRLHALRQQIDARNADQCICRENKAFFTIAGDGSGISIHEEHPSITFALDKPDASPDPSAVKVDLTSELKTTISFCYLIEYNGKYHASQCARRVVEKGRNTVYFRIVRPQTHALLTIKPAKPETYTIHALDVKRESRTNNQIITSYNP